MKTLSDFDLTATEILEYNKLKVKIFGKGVLKELFVELDFKNPAHKRYNELSLKMVKLNAYLVANRHLL